MRHRERGTGAQIGLKRDGSRRGIGIGIGIENAERGRGRAASNKAKRLHSRGMGEVRKNPIRHLLPVILRQHLLPPSQRSFLQLRCREEMQRKLSSDDRERENGVGGEGHESWRKCRSFADASPVPLGPQLSMLLRLSNDRPRFARKKD